MALRFWPRSLIVQILIIELGAILFVASLLPTIMAWSLHQQMNRYEEQTLAAQASEIQTGVIKTGAGIAVRLKPDLEQAYATPYDGRAYVLVDASGKILAQSAYARFVSWERAPRAPTLTTFRIGTIVGVSRPILAGTIPAWILVTQDETGPGAIIDDVAHAFLTHYAPILLAILLLLPLVNSLFIRRLVVEVRAVSRQATTIGPRTLDLRLDTSALPVEVAPLAEATNSLLARLQHSFAQQAEFVANVAHELRTPLAVLKIELDALPDARVRAQTKASVDKLGHVIAQLQALAELEIAIESFATFDLVEVAQDVIGELAPQILDAGDTIELNAPNHVSVHANRTLVALALSNLVSNATRHTPAGTAILVGISSDGVVEVVDDGPGIASDHLDRSKLRYWRADNRRSDSAGLGLSIVTRIMEVHGGELEIAVLTEGKGSRFALCGLTVA